MLRSNLFAVVLMVATLGAAPAPQLAFPEAEGAGRHAQGGRGGTSIVVTSLADSGPGTLRAAVEAKGARVVTFAVAGTIHLNSDLTIRNPRITISGLNAPAGGIALADHSLIVKADDVVIRYIRSRLGDISRVQGDAITLSSGRRIILDHVSASWSTDEALSVSARYTPTEGLYDVTVQWSIISESLRNSVHEKGAHGYGSLVRGGRGSRFTFHHNLWAHHVQRMPRPGNYTPASEDPEGALIEFRSNVFYNWGSGRAGYNADKDSNAAYNFIDNCYISGPNSKGSLIFDEGNPLARSWFSGNLLNGIEPADPWSLTSGVVNRLIAPLDVAPVRPDPARSACDKVLNSAGASLPRDSVDSRIVSDVKTGKGGIIDSQNEVGGWPDLLTISQ